MNSSQYSGLENGDSRLANAQEIDEFNELPLEENEYDEITGEEGEALYKELKYRAYPKWKVWFWSLLPIAVTTLALAYMAYALPEDFAVLFTPLGIFLLLVMYLLPALSTLLIIGIKNEHRLPVIGYGGRRILVGDYTFFRYTYGSFDLRRNDRTHLASLPIQRRTVQYRDIVKIGYDEKKRIYEITYSTHVWEFGTVFMAKGDDYDKKIVKKPFTICIPSFFREDIPFKLISEKSRVPITPIKSRAFIRKFQLAFMWAFWAFLGFSMALIIFAVSL